MRTLSENYRRAGLRFLKLALLLVPLLVGMMWLTPPHASASILNPISDIEDALKKAIESVINDVLDEIPVVKQVMSFVQSAQKDFDRVTGAFGNMSSNASKIGNISASFNCAFTGLMNADSGCLDNAKIIANAKTLATTLYTALFVIELVMLGIQFALFRDNLAEFFASIAMKVFVSSFFMWAIANSNTLFSQVMNGFKAAGQQILPGSPDPVTIWGELLATAAAFFAAGAEAHVTDTGIGGVAGISIFGIADIGAGVAGVLGHENFILITQFLGFLVLGAAAAIMLTGILITVESLIVMSAGIVFLGFAGSRFTIQYAQGYFSYCMNIGVKMFAFYLVLAVVAEPVKGILASAAVTLGIAAALPFGAGGELATGVAALATVEVIVMAALVWFIPNLAASFLSGQSALSTSAVMGNLAGAVSGLTAIQAGMKQEGALRASAPAQDTRLARHELHAGASSAHHVSSGGRGQGVAGMPAAPAPAHFATPHPSSEGLPATGLIGLKSEDIRALSDLDFHTRLTETSWTRLSEDARATITSDARLRPLAQSVMDQRAQALEAQAATFRSQIAGGLRGAVPSGEAPPTAVGVRLSQPDKL